MTKLLNRHLGALIVAVATLVLGFFSLRGPGAMQVYMESWTFPIMTAALLLLVFALLPFLSSLQLSRISFRNRATQSVLVGLVFTIFLFHSLEPSFKLFADESNLMATSESFLKFKSAKIIASQFVEHGATNVLESQIPKQPYLFSYLLSLVHLVIGYSVENAFLLNALICVVFTSLLFYAFAGAGLWIGLSAVLLFFTTPLTNLTVTSGDFTFLFFVMFFILVFLLSRLREGWNQPTFFLFWICSVLTVHSRYEAVALVGLLWIFAILKKIIPWSALRENLLLLSATPILCMPLIWQQLIYWIRFSGGHTEYTGALKTADEIVGTFSLTYWPANLKHFFASALDPFNNQPYAAVVYIISLLALGLALKRDRKKPVDPERRRLHFILGAISLVCLAHFAILMTYFFGEAGYPTTARYFIGLVSFLSLWPLLVLAERARAKFLPHAFIVCVFTFFYFHSFAQNSPYRNNIYQVKAYYWFVNNYINLLGEKDVIIHDYSVNLVMHRKNVLSSPLFNAGWPGLVDNFQRGRLRKLYVLEVAEPNVSDLSKIDPKALEVFEPHLIDRTGLNLGVRGNLFELRLKPATK